MRGRKPKPSAIKELEGNPGKRAINKKEPKAPSAIPPCPKHLQGEGRKEWRRITKELHALGVLTRIDRGALVALCQAWADYVQACGKVDEQEAVVVSDKGGMYQNPWVGIKNSAMDRYVRISSEFGMTPSSRSRVKVEGPTEADKMAELLFGTGTKVVK